MYIADDYEYSISRKVYFIFTLVFSILFLYSIIYRLFYPTSEPNTEFVLILRISGFVLNLSGLILFHLHKSSKKQMYASGIFLTLVNFCITRIAQIIQSTDQGSSAVIFSMSIIYVLFIALFTHSFLPTLLFSLFIIACYVMIFFFFPDLFFTVPESIRDQTSYLTMNSANLLFTLVIASLLNQSVARILYKKLRSNRDYLENLAYYDQDTGLPNGRLLDITITDQITAHETESIMLMGFRILGITDLNSRIGFEKTNQWIISYTNKVTDQITQWYEQHEIKLPIDFKLYRVETMTFLFWISCPQKNDELKLRALEEIPKFLTSALEGNEHKIRLDFSGAFTAYPDDTRDPPRMQKLILGILHQTRNTGSNRFIPYNSGDFLKYQKQEELLQLMADPTFIQELRGVFQPKIVLHDSRCMGFEALIRWNNPRLGNIPPSDFIHLAETTQAIETITWAILEYTEQFISDIRETRTEDFRVSINMSPVLIKKEWFTLLNKWIAIHDIGRYLELEITEGILFNMTAEIEEYFGDLRKIGVSFSIDDFGTGYSNLSYLQSFRADYLKVDKSFIDELPDNKTNADLVDTIIHIASIFGMKTVIEGVERIEQIEYLKSVGCDIIQGYYFSKPLEKPDAIAYFREHGAPV
jgi:EAL domain-containing protein (putative c-di-GMP-specific phosphodiesterase class I)/GGDEF domain-containing protein